MARTRLKAPLALLFASAALLTTPGRAAPQDRPARPGSLVAVVGEVLEQESGEPVAGARVQLVGVQETVTDRDGWFDLPGVQPGRYTLRIEHVGYGIVERELELPEKVILEVTVQLVPHPLDLEPIVAVVERMDKLAVWGFYDRRHRGMGYFLTREEFDKPGRIKVTDALRQVPGLRVVPVARHGLTQGSAVVLRGGCRPAIYLDGMHLSDAADWSLDDLINPSDVEGIEVYKGPSTPVRFSPVGAGGCGAVVVWTRQGGRDGRLPFWKGALYTVLFLGLMVGLTR